MNEAAEGGGALASLHHRPPAVSIAASSARLDSVRRLPALWGISGWPTASRLADKARANSSCWTVRPGQPLGPSAEVFDAMIVSRLVPDPDLQIGHVEVGVKQEQDARLFEHLRRGAGGVLAYTVGTARRISVGSVMRMLSSGARLGRPSGKTSRTLSSDQSSPSGPSAMRRRPRCTWRANARR